MRRTTRAWEQRKDKTMTALVLRDIDLAGDAGRRAATDLLLAARGDDPMAGIFEAGDLQWWWALDDGSSARYDTFWLDARDQPMACLLCGKPADTAYTEFFWRPALPEAIRAWLVDRVVDHLTAKIQPAGQRVWITVDARDTEFRARLAAAGIVHQPADDIVQMWQQPERIPDPVRLADGFIYTTAAERPAGTLHHLAKRNGEYIADRLAQQSLYRADLDFCIRTGEGEVAAYCLCWLDPVNGVGLFEPVRTEDAWQRQGLGRDLMTEGIRRLMQQGATLIKVSRDRSNRAAERLYTSVGFRDAHAKLRYVG